MLRIKALDFPQRRRPRPSTASGVARAARHRHHQAGAYGIVASLAVIYFWFGGMQFTAYEAEGLVPLVGNSPVLSWMYDILRCAAFPHFSASWS